MIVFGITGLRSKKRLLLKILLALLLVLALLPFLFHHYINANAESGTAPVQAEEIGEGEENAVTYPGDPVRVSTDFDHFWLGLLGDSDGV